MQLDYDKIHYTSLIPAYMKVQEGSFTINVSGSVGAGLSATFNGSDSVAITKGSLKVYIRQSPVPVSTIAYYDSNSLLPVPAYGAGSGTPSLILGASGAASEIDALFWVSLGPSGISASINIFNPNAGSITLTSTTFTVYYRVYAPTFETS